MQAEIRKDAELRSDLEELEREPDVPDEESVPPPPITPKIFPQIKQIDPRGKNRKPHTGDYAFYMSIDWAEWWDEFSTRLSNNKRTKGKLKYRSARQFAYEKGKNTYYRNLIYYMIGPKPDPTKQKASKVPWLGDWQKRRTSTFGYLEDQQRLKGIAHAIKERLATFEAAQAFCPVIELQVKEALWFYEQIKTAFGGQPFLPDEAPDSPDNIKRTNRYLHLVEQIHKMLGIAQERWLQVNGLNPSDAENWMKMLMMSAGVGGALGAQLRLQLDNGEGPQSQYTVTPTHILMAKNMVEKARLYDLELDPNEIPDPTPGYKTSGKPTRKTEGKVERPQ